MAHSHEARARSVVKALSWRALATLTTITLVILYTGELSLAMAVGGTEVVAKMIIYYVHERAWALVDWGMKA